MTDAPKFYQHDLSYHPPHWMRPSIVQTALASFKHRKRGTSAMEDASVPLLLNCGVDDAKRPVRLMASYSRAPENKAVAIFLHGWEGSQDSTYVVSCARRLYDQGVSVFRLNYRDHGNTHHLNEGLFFATRFDEVFAAIKHGVELSGGQPAYVIGFSLGGNFALRTARALKNNPVPNLAHIFAISPVIDPWAASPLVDESGLLIQRYFKKKLRNSLKKKQTLYPDIYDFSQTLGKKTIAEMSEDIIPGLSGFADQETYFSAYGIAPDDLSDCQTPVSIITSKDDPITPADHLQALRLSETCRAIVLDYGGHNGFFQSLTGPTWYDDYIMREIFA